MGTMFGWSSDAASCDSRRNRSRKRSFSASSGARSFSATLRPSRRSSARYTAPIPPRPSKTSSRKPASSLPGRGSDPIGIFLPDNKTMTGAQRVGGYVFEDELGAEAVGTVYRARAADGRLVAVKLLRPELAGDDAFRRRFDHEARAAQAVSHRHLVAVLEHGEDDGRPYLALEYV